MKSEELKKRTKEFGLKVIKLVETLPKCAPNGKLTCGAHLELDSPLENGYSPSRRSNPLWFPNHKTTSCYVNLHMWFYIGLRRWRCWSASSCAALLL